VSASRRRNLAAVAMWVIFLPGALATLVPQLMKRSKVAPTGGDCSFGCKGGLCLGGGAGYCTERCKKSSDCPADYFCNKEKVCQHEPWKPFGEGRCDGVPAACLGECLSAPLESYCTDRCESTKDCPSGYSCAEIPSASGYGSEPPERLCVRSAGVAPEFPDYSIKRKIGGYAFDGCDSGKQLGHGIWAYCTDACITSSDCPAEYRCNRDHLCERRPEKPSVAFSGMCRGRGSVCMSGICVSLVLPDHEAPALNLYPITWCTDPCDEKRPCPKGFECKSFEGLSTKVCSPIRRPEIEKTLKYFVTTREKEEREAAEDVP
jgi:hypothetical protein